jgi:hypothetical protein
MNISELKTVLAAAGDSRVEVILPDGSIVPAHYHVTEVGVVSKDFFDCGGTRRRDEYCALQLWVASDIEHGLTASKIASIIRHTEPVIAERELPVMVEYQRDSIARYAIGSANRVLGKLAITLTPVFTDCLAPDRCGISGQCC